MTFVELVPIYAQAHCMECEDVEFALLKGKLTRRDLFTCFCEQKGVGSLSTELWDLLLSLRF